MKQFSVAVDKIEDGILHVRSAGLIMKEASQFASDVKEIGRASCRERV